MATGGYRNSELSMGNIQANKNSNLQNTTSTNMKSVGTCV